MESINYLSKRYQRFISEMAQGTKGKPNTLVVLNGASNSNLNAVTSDISSAANKGIYVPKGIIGEQSRLSEIFAKARDDNEVLLLDEADSLFGKRGEVKDSHDRYANTEVSHLLKSIDNHDGLVILASNKRKSLHPSLASKIDILIQFPPYVTWSRKIFMKLKYYSKPKAK